MTDETTSALEADAPAAVPVSNAPATLRFKPPVDVSGIAFSTGRQCAVADGVLTLPDDLIADERASLAANGFTLLL